MKKLLTITAVGALLATPAIAVQKCVALGVSSTTCTGTQSQFEGFVDWSVTCTTSGNEIPVQGISSCSPDIPVDYGYTTPTVYATADTISSGTSDDDVTRTGCWCKMISPAISPWVFVADFKDGSEDCAPLCAGACVNRIIKTPNTSFKTAMFSNLSD